MSWRQPVKQTTINRMATGDSDDRIAELYQGPLEEFTAARNALAKETGDSAIKKLEKPNLRGLGRQPAVLASTEAV